jgi:hypothetical protein
MTTKQIKTKKVVRILYAAVLSMGFAACDDGNLNTVIEQETLAEYMGGNPDIRLFMSNIPNYREDLFVCAYLDEGWIASPSTEPVLLTPTPAGKFGTTEGIPFGEITAVELPGIDGFEQSAYLHGYFTTDGLTPCAEEWGVSQTDGVIADFYRASPSAGLVYIPNGFLSTAQGGEDWSICGDAGNEPCDLYAGVNSFGFWDLQYNPPLDPSMTNLVVYDIDLTPSDTDPGMTICWDPDGAGEEPSQLVRNDSDFDPSAWFDIDPITEGVLHVHEGAVDCATANIGDASASTVLPAEATFGPEGSEVAFGPNSSGALLYVGIEGENVPQEARPRLIPVLKW